MDPAGVNRRAMCGRSLLANPQIFRGRFAPVLHLFVAHLSTLIEVAQAGFFHGRDVHKHVLAAVVGNPNPLIALNHFTVPVATFCSPWENNHCTRAAKSRLGKKTRRRETGLSHCALRFRARGIGGSSASWLARVAG